MPKTMMITVDKMMPTLKRYIEYNPAETVSLVAIEGGNEDWAAYIESSYSRKHITSTVKQSIIASGQKVTADEGCSLFPSWAARLEWRY